MIRINIFSPSNHFVWYAAYFAVFTTIHCNYILSSPNLSHQLEYIFSSCVVFSTCLWSSPHIASSPVDDHRYKTISVHSIICPYTTYTTYKRTLKPTSCPLLLLCTLPLAVILYHLLLVTDLCPFHSHWTPPQHLDQSHAHSSHCIVRRRRHQTHATTTTTDESLLLWPSIGMHQDDALSLRLVLWQCRVHDRLLLCCCGGSCSSVGRPWDTAHHVGGARLDHPVG